MKLFLILAFVSSLYCISCAPLCPIDVNNASELDQPKRDMLTFLAYIKKNQAENKNVSLENFFKMNPETKMTKRDFFRSGAQWDSNIGSIKFYFETKSGCRIFCSYIESNGWECLLTAK